MWSAALFMESPGAVIVWREVYLGDGISRYDLPIRLIHKSPICHKRHSALDKILQAYWSKIPSVSNNPRIPIGILGLLVRSTIWSLQYIWISVWWAAKEAATKKLKVAFFSLAFCVQSPRISHIQQPQIPVFVPRSLLISLFALLFVKTHLVICSCVFPRGNNTNGTGVK